MEVLTINHVGADGDGVSFSVSGEPIYIPFALAGERVETESVDGRRRLLRVIDASADRVAPVCRHFGVCGGCSLQHMSRPAYLDWKRRRVIDAFASQRLSPAVAETSACAGFRRRAVMTARSTAGGAELGFYAASSHELIDIEMCSVLHPAIVGALPGLRAMFAPLLPRRKPARVTIVLTRGGLDVAVADVEKALSADRRTELALAAAKLSLARVSINADVAYASSPATLAFGDAKVELPPGAFVQAVAEAERAMAETAVEAIGKSRRVADLFCGVGSFSFPLAARSKVDAFDADGPAIAALNAAARRTQGLKPVVGRRRDLFREPLSTLELQDYDAVVFDPPRAGAEAQARMLARSKVKCVVAVSCNPVTLARDARVLSEGGFHIAAVTPFDQFRFSPHVEVVAVFRR